MTNLNDGKLTFPNRWGGIVVLAIGLAVSSSWASDLAVDHLFAVKSGDVAEEFHVGQTDPSGLLCFNFDTAPTSNHVYDQSASFHVGTVWSGATWTAAGHTEGSAAFSFSGVMSGSITLTNIPALNNPATTKAITMTAWVQTTNAYGHVIGAYSGTAPHYGYSLAFGFGGVNKLSLWTGGSAWYGGGSTEATDGNWHFVAAVVQSNNYTLYVDANVDGQGTCDPITSYTGTRAIGHRADAGSWPFVGKIDEVQIFDRALSSQEVAAVRSGTRTAVYSNVALRVEAGAVTIPRLVPQGDIGMGIYSDGP